MIDPRPSFFPADAERLARQIFGLEARADELPAERDRNFLLVDGSGSRYVFKATPGDVPRDELAAQIEVLRFLESSDLAPGVPSVLPTIEGGHLHRLEAEGVWVRLYRFLEGRRLVELPEAAPELMRELGRFLGRLDRTLLAFDHPGAHRASPWDLMRTLELSSEVDQVEDAGRRRLLEKAWQRFRERVAPALPKLRRSVVHNDANDHNVLVARDGAELRGLIDFGDLMHTITVAELAIACSYAMLDRDDPLAVGAQIVAGYDGELPLSPLEKEVLPGLILGRLATSAIMASRRRSLAPENEYLLVSEAPVWRLLERLLERPMHEGLVALCHPGSPERSHERILELRRRHLGGNLSLSYRRPLEIVRGEGAYLIDERGRRYLDLVNNVCHVGHCHPRVVAAIQRQVAVLNTNTRYLHDLIVEYARRLSATFPEPLSVCYFVCSGSEANELALRLARAATGRRQLVVFDHAYHGNTQGLVEISPYKCEGPGGSGLADYVRKVPLPDPFRGLYRGEATGPRYADEVRRVLAELRLAGRPIGAFLAESLPGCAGQIVLPDGYLEEVFREVRAQGGVCIADEVQVGFGRVGRCRWGFELQGVVPDIVTLGKPIGNGHPLAAVLTTPEIDRAFDNGMEYFNTFGGNPVSCAAGLAVLEVLEAEGLQSRALSLGGRLIEGLRKMQARYPLIGDVRGEGLFLGVELIRGGARLEPAGSEADQVTQEMRERGILLSTDGPDHNVLKIKPPLVLAATDVERFLEQIDGVFEALQD